MITLLEWDSSFFGYPVGRITLKTGEGFNHALFDQEKTNYHLIYIISEQPVEFLEEGFIHADTKTLYEKRLPSEMNHRSPQCTPFINNLEEKLLLEKLVLESGKYSRFKRDKEFINHEFERMYKAWLDASILGTFAKAILVYRSDNHISGFIIVIENDDKTASVWLIAVDPQKRGLGIGKALIYCAEDFAIQNGYLFMQVITQQVNTEARSLYERNGYKLKDITYTYHYRNP